jgi:hypothetical protein
MTTWTWHLTQRKSRPAPRLPALKGLAIEMLAAGDPNTEDIVEKTRRTSEIPIDQIASSLP